MKGEQRISYDVAVVGAGPVGLTLANLLGRHGHRVVVLERWPAPYPRPRAVHFDEETARVLAEAGVGEAVRNGEPVTTYEWRNATGQLLLQFDWSGTGQSGWPIATMFHQPDLERALRARAEARGSVTVLFGHTVTGLDARADGVEIAVDGPDGALLLGAGWVVGCDGANSLVREHMGTAVTDLGFCYDWLIVDVLPHAPAGWDPTNVQICDPVRPTTAVSGGPGRRRWEFMRLPGETLETLNTEETAWRLLEPWGVTPETAALERHTVYTFQARWADHWRAGRLLLAGDAAHLMPPFAGQGMCSGIRDAANLAWKLDLVLTARAGAELLDTYEAERQAHVRHAIGMSVELGKVICVTDAAGAAERDAFMIGNGADPARVLPPVPPSTLTAGLLHRNPAGEAMPGAGVLASQPGLAPAFVVATTLDPCEALSDNQLARLQSLGAVLSSLSPDAGVAGLVIRPDHYVFAAATTPDELADAVTDLLAQLPSSGGEPRIVDFARAAEERASRELPGYQELHEWSVDDLEGFWATVWEFFEVDSGYECVLADDRMPGARWFPGARLNYAEHALRGESDEPAVLAITEDGETTTLSWDELREQVGAFAGWLRARGVRRGDRVVGYLPSAVPALVAFLATASLGAVWSVCGQDYGAEGAAARFGQLEPSVLIAADGYRFNGRVHDRRSESARLLELLPTVHTAVLVDHVGLRGESAMVSWADAVAGPVPLAFERVDFDAPLWVLFSSGTTGVPKGIVHGHGGVLLEHLKLTGLHLDLRAGERFFWYTTTNWMMWNMVVSGLLADATVVLYDGSPGFPDPGRLWALAAEHRISVLGVSPGYLLACAKAGVEPVGLGALRVVGSTGAPLPAGCYDWVAEHVGSVQLASTTGGTDVVSGFAGSAPNTPVRPGEISAPLLGVALESWDPDGKPVRGAEGELVITRPMPSMPVAFWNDPDGTRYRDAYFSAYPGVWRHGDWVTVTERGGVIVSGRSDSTLNRHGVRLGSADIYTVVEKLPEVREALVIGAELPDGGYWMPLFVVLEDGVLLDESLTDRINAAIRTQASPRHVPDVITAVPGIPHTRTGKKLEVPVKRLLQGTPIERVLDRDTVDDPALLDFYARLAPGQKDTE